MADTKQLTSDEINLFDSILDGTLADIPDLPSFAAWPSGCYKVVSKDGFQQKKIGDHPAFELKCKWLETLELADAADEKDAPKDGSELSLNFMMDNDLGRGFFKEAVKPIAQFLELDESIPGAGRAVIEASKGMELVIVVQRKSRMKDGEQVFNCNLKKLTVSV